MSHRRPPTLQKLTTAHLVAAARAWTGRYPPFRDGNAWEVIIEGQRFPPKAITALAHEMAGFGRLTTKDISGRSSHGFLHERLAALGFELAEKGST